MGRSVVGRGRTCVKVVRKAHGSWHMAGPEESQCGCSERMRWEDTQGQGGQKCVQHEGC